MTIRDYRRAWLNQQRKYWRFMTICYAVLSFLAAVCVVLWSIKIAATFAGAILICLILWVIAMVGYTTLTIGSACEWRYMKKELKELDNE